MNKAVAVGSGLNDTATPPEDMAGGANPLFSFVRIVSKITCNRDGVFVVNTVKTGASEPMNPPTAQSTVGVLASGGLDSCILISHLLRQDCRVCPIHVRCGLIWEDAEMAGLRAFLRAIATPKLDELVTLELPLDDLYGRHWSTDGQNPPDADTPADAVYLPGRNALLTIKPAVWCGLHGIECLALATLAGNPFADATSAFFQEMENTLELATGNRLTIVRPFAKLDKCEVVRLGEGLPIELTFSCLAPIDGLHCGQCNKCAERRNAFHTLSISDPTRYVNPPKNGHLTIFDPN